MLRPELKTLAAENAAVHVCGRLLEVHRNGDNTDLLLKHCEVRKLEQGQPVNLHPAIRTDHLWLRVPTEMLEPREAPAGTPDELRSMMRRKPLELLTKQCVAGRAGFYTDRSGALGIGVTEVIPVIHGRKLQSMVSLAVECFLTHPWRSECLRTLERVIEVAIDTVQNDWVMQDCAAADAVRVMKRTLRRCQLNHQSEAKARRHNRQATLPGLNPLVDAIQGGLTGKNGRSSSLDALLANAALDEAANRRYGMLR